MKEYGKIHQIHKTEMVETIHVSESKAAHILEQQVQMRRFRTIYFLFA